MNHLKDLVLLIARVGVGVVLIAHGWEKVNTVGMPETVAGFTGMGVPAPQVSAYVAMVIELVGGVAILLGLTVSVVGVLVALEMAGAIAIVHGLAEVFVGRGGFELALLLGLSALLLAVFGAGRYSLDRLFGLSGRHRDEATDTSDPGIGPEGRDEVSA